MAPHEPWEDWGTVTRKDQKAKAKWRSGDAVAAATPKRKFLQISLGKERGVFIFTLLFLNNFIVV